VTDGRGAGPRWSGVAWAAAGTELRRWRRQRLAVAAALVVPIAMAALVSLALGTDVGALSATLAVADEDRGPAATAFRREVLGSPAVRDAVAVEEVDGEAAARRLVDDEDVDAAIVVPAGITERLASEGRSGIEVVRGDAEPIAGDLAALLVDQFDIRARAQVLAAERAGADPPEPWRLQVAVTTPGGDRLDAATYYGPAVGLFFVLVTMGLAASQLVADRQRGVVERLAAAPAPRSAVVVGRAAAAVTVGALSLGTLAAAMQLLFGRSWGPPIPVIAVTAATLVGMGGVTAVLATVARAPDQAQALAVGVAFVLALASGSFTPPGGADRPAVAAWVPTTHALDAYALLTTERAGLAAVGPAIAALVAFGAAGVLVTSVLARRLVR
jgi:ABC-2 type transport system permease protein